MIKGTHVYKSPRLFVAVFVTYLSSPMHFAFIEGAARRWVAVQFDKRPFPRGLKPFQFTAPIGAAEAAPFQSKYKTAPLPGADVVFN